MATPPPPAPSALVRQFSASSAAPPKKVPSLQHCFLSDGFLMFKNIYSFKLPLASLWRTSTADLQYSLLCICLRLGHTCDNIKLQGSQDASAQQTARTSPLRGVNRLKNNLLGANSSHTTRTFNLTCSHLR